MDQARLREAPVLLRVTRVPERVERDVRLAVVADLQAQLGRSGLLAGLELARARAREVVEVDALETRQPAGGRRVERHQRLGLPGGQRALERGGRVARERAHQEGALALVGDHRHGGPPAVRLLSQASTSGAASRFGKRPSSSVTSFAMRASAGTRHCLRRQSNQRRGSSLDRLVQILVEAEVEDQLGALARILVAQPDAGLRRVGFGWERRGGQTDELSAAGDRYLRS